jgi:ABC-type cobalamin/Fe3+-siderophores transport system ATPase subunit
MDDNPNDSGLLLPDLHIENFRGIKKLSIPRLGRVTLLVGRNGVGKTTVLDAIRIYAARGRHQVLAQTLDVRDEITTPRDPSEDGPVQVDWAAMFHGRSISEESSVSIGPREKTGQLRIKATILDYEDPAYSFVPRKLLQRLSGDRLRVFEVDNQGHGYFLIPLGYGGTLPGAKEMLPEIKHEVAGPGLLARSDVARIWNKVALTDDEERIARAIGLIYGVDVGRVGVIGDDVRETGGDRLRAIVRLKSYERPVPLRSLGEGAQRLFGVALALANSRDGILLIDEAENGIHYSVQQEFWRMVLQTACENNVQVFATTHSWDCVRGFARAAVENGNVEGVLVRLEKEEDGLRAVRYSERRLKIAAEQRIEVR